MGTWVGMVFIAVPRGRSAVIEETEEAEETEERDENEYVEKDEEREDGRESDSESSESGSESESNSTTSSTFVDGVSWGEGVERGLAAQTIATLPLSARTTYTIVGSI